MQEVPLNSNLSLSHYINSPLVPWLGTSRSWSRPLGLVLVGVNLAWSYYVTTRKRRGIFNHFFMSISNSWFSTVKTEKRKKKYFLLTQTNAHANMWVYTTHDCQPSRQKKKNLFSFNTNKCTCKHEKWLNIHLCSGHYIITSGKTETSKN